VQSLSLHRVAAVLHHQRASAHRSRDWQRACSSTAIMPQPIALRSSWVFPIVCVAFVLAAGIVLWASVSTPQAEAGGAGVVLLATAALLRRSLPSSSGAANPTTVARGAARIIAEGQIR
jgi:hypothetical protein